MRRNSFMISIATLLIVGSCGVPAEKVERMQGQIDSLVLVNRNLSDTLYSVRSELERYQFAPEKILAKAESAFKSGDRPEIVKQLDLISKYHHGPEAWTGKL